MVCDEMAGGPIGVNPTFVSNKMGFGAAWHGNVGLNNFLKRRKSTMKSTHVIACCIVTRSANGERFATNPPTVDPLTHALPIAVSQDEVHAEILLKLKRANNPELYADARIALVNIEITEMTREEILAYRLELSRQREGE